ncbi:MAG: Phosphoglycerate dehydrogenase and related dehydrogenase [Chthonomonadaceae bacterium]|nr:Phosphoglycerate dehydrogenase and related dehydrogenase [Chthonomonadaceae bacterium]
MSKTVVLVMLPAGDKDEQAFQDAIAADAELKERVELRFGRGDEAKAQIGEAEIVVSGHVSEELLEAAPHLRWIAFWSAGMDGKINETMRARNLALTNASGVHGPNIAEHVLGFMLMFIRELHLHMRSQVAGVWTRNGNSQRLGANELAGQTLGIVGLGRIGEALAARAKACEMRVVATKRDPNARYEASVVPDALYPPEELPRLLAESDHVCIALPYTAETHHLFDAALLAHMKPTAYLYNIGRGKVVDETALIEALRAGTIAGAGLDVFETEPLPADSPLWKMENVILTPHTSGVTPYYFTRFAALFTENLRRYLNDQPLQNLYDPERGY